MNLLKDYIIPITTGIRNINAKNAFERLTSKEKDYVYNFSKAAWAGAKICYF